MGDDRVTVTSRWIEIDGAPTIPISGEIHYSRIPANLWDQTLRRAREGGITHVATYAIWNHHERVKGRARFDGDLDLRRFLLAVRRHGMEVVLRVGPYAHAEARNGGFPDWLLEMPLQPRSDDPAYLAQARRWFELIADQARGIPLFALQIENELYDGASHLATLKTIARTVGLDAPIWTATGWGGANIPADELLPTFAGYSDAFWIAADHGFDVSSASNFYFSDDRDEVGVGADTRDVALTPSNLDLSRYPYATCELGGGMPAAYHRRPAVAAQDVAALALTKLGSGSVWQGYYMYSDGRNPGRSLQESHESGGNNDFPELSYDFGAPLTVDAHTRPAWSSLRMQHQFIHAFGARLARMPAFFPEDAPAVPDLERLRYAVRSDGESGFLFVVNHQPGVRLPCQRDVTWTVRMPQATVTLPAVDVPSGALFVWPLRLSIGAAVLEWATAQPITLTSWRGAPLLVLAAVAGIEPRMSWRDAEIFALPDTRAPGTFWEVRRGDTVLARVLVLNESEAMTVDTSDGLVVDAEHRMRLAVSGWEPIDHASVCREYDTTWVQVRAAGVPPTPIAGGPLGRASIPRDWSSAALYELFVDRGPGHDLIIEWEGDVARAWTGDHLVSDSLYVGRPWRIPAADVPATGTVMIEILPAHPSAPVHWAVRPLPETAKIVRATLSTRR